MTPPPRPPPRRSGAGDLTPEGIARTEQLIRPYIRRTPVLETRGAEIGLAAGTVAFKLEFCQHAGSFKARGAFANLLSREIPAAGVVAASGGNHGVAVAYAAHALSIRARIFVPGVASPEKIERIRSYGADLVITGDLYADALSASERWGEESGALSIHAYDQIETLLGQGTLALEFEQQAPALDTWLVAVGGGGLLGGIAAWFRRQPPLVKIPLVKIPLVKIIAVEPEAAPTLTHALRAGRPVDSPAGGLAADSLAPRRVGELMFPLAQERVSDVVLVSDDAIQHAQQTLWSLLRIVVEPGGAAAFAALTSRAYTPQPGERVGVILCGSNTGAVTFSRASGQAVASSTP